METKRIKKKSKNRKEKEIKRNENEVFSISELLKDTQRSHSHYTNYNKREKKQHELINTSHTYKLTNRGKLSLTFKRDMSGE